MELDNYLAEHKQFLGQILTKRFIQPDPFEFKGIREYQPHDSLRSVNFKATAKTGDLMVNVNDYTVTQEIVLILNLQYYIAYPSESLFEQTLRLASALAGYYIGNSIPLQLATNANLTHQTPQSAVRLESGSGYNHLNAFNELMAHIDLRQDTPIPGHALLEEEVRRYKGLRKSGREPAYILISTDHGAKFVQAYETLRLASADVLWLIPALPYMEVKTPFSERVIRVDVE
jgi:uncharacterized protein (DUF58 family)